MATQISYSPSRIITAAFIVESIANVAGGAAMVAAPDKLLSFFARDQSFVTPIAELFFQIAGGITIAFTAPLALGLRGGPKEKRIAYQFLAAGELVLIPYFLAKYLSKSDSGFSKESGLLIMTGTLLPLLIWRIWCLGWRPEWFGQEQGEIVLE